MPMGSALGRPTTRVLAMSSSARPKRPWCGASRCDPSVQIPPAGKVGHSCILLSVQGVTKL